MNVVILVGNLGQDPETKVTTNGTTVMRFSMATQEWKKDQQGNREDYAVWHQVKVLGRSAEGLSRFLVKGMKVAVNGRLAVDQWEDDQGVRKTFVYVIANTCDVLTPKDQQSSGRPVQTTQQQRRPQTNVRGPDPFRNPPPQQRQPAPPARAPQPDTSFEPPFDDAPDFDDPMGGYRGN